MRADRHRSDAGPRLPPAPSTRAPERAPATGAEVARKNTPVAELLGGETQLGRDDQRLEQTLADRLAQEDKPIFALDRQPGNDSGGIGTGGDDDRMRLEICRRRHRLDPDLEPSREPLDDALRPVEIAVVRAPRAARERFRVQAGDEGGGLSRRNETRGNALRILHGDVGCQAIEGLRGVRHEQVAAALETEGNERLE